MTSGSATWPLVTIVTPSFNQVEFIEQTIKSVLSQSYDSIEYILIDGGSTDGSVEIVRRYASRLAFWTSEPDQGQTDAINKGWQRATGEIVTWLNSDDVLLPEAVARAVAFFNDNPAVDIVFADCEFIDAVGNVVGRSRERAVFDYSKFIVSCENPIPQPAAFIRKSVLDNVGVLDASYHYIMDWEYWARAGLQHRIAHVPEIWAQYRLHESSKTVHSSHRARMPAELERLYESIFRQVALPKQIRDQHARAVANMYFTSGGYAMAAGDGGLARRLGIRALVTYPLLVFSPRMVHQLIYCCWGGGQLYRWLRQLRQRAGGERAVA